MPNRTTQLTKEIMKTVSFGSNDAETETYIKACLLTIQGEAERAERQKISDLVRTINLDEITEAGTIADLIKNL